jgi:hypothetical protein
MKICDQCKGRSKRNKYCSNKCRQLAKDEWYKKYISNWKLGKISGLNSNGVVTPQIKNYLRLKYNNHCALCDWSVINSHTGLVPLVADHIDGNWKNNIESNLRLICPNCDSLQSTYGGANRGSGRGYLKIVKKSSS